jgi:TRAP transporter 4TM/12TM fusion protein
MPPVMGAGAFLLADIVGVPYLEVAYAAAIPAILYYLSCYCMIDLEALKRNLQGLSRDTLPNLKKVVADGWHLFLPVIVLIASMIWLEVSPIRAGFYGALAAILASWLRRHTRVKLRQIWEGLDQAGRGAVEIAATCGAAGIIIGIITLTGLGNKFANVLLTYAGDNVLLALVLTMVVALVLGMGVPTTAAYAICAATLAPGLVKLGIYPLAAHLFIFYFAVLSCITPPVAVAAYAAAAIAKTDAWGVGWTATRLGIAAFIVPYMFVFGPALLGRGAWYEVLWALLTASLGIIALSTAVQGWFLQRMGWLARLAAGAAALLLIDPGLTTDAIGFGLLVPVFIFQVIARRKDRAASAAGGATA